MSDVIAVKGLSELNRFLQELPARIEQNVLTGGLRAAANVIKEEARRLVPVKTGGLRDAIRVSVRRRKGKVTARVVVSGTKARWVEYGTPAHWIRVKEEERPSRMTRRGRRTFSVTTLNRMAARGSLKIGTHFVGASLEHPGAKPKPYMRPALNNKAREAVLAAGMYIRNRLATKHGLTQASEVELELM